MMNIYYTFYKIRYKRYFLLFPILIALCSLFLWANISNILDKQYVNANIAFGLFFSLCTVYLLRYFIRMLSIKKPYIGLNSKGLEYADIWYKKINLPYNEITKTDLNSFNLEGNVGIDLEIYTWDHKLQAQTGFGDNKIQIKIRVFPCEYKNLDFHFITLLSILKYLNINQRQELLEKIKTDHQLALTHYMTPVQKALFDKNQVILINNQLL